MPSNIFTRDVALKMTTKCRQFRVVAVSTTNILLDTMRRHELLLPAASGGSAVDPSLQRTVLANLDGNHTVLPQLAHVVTLANMWASLLNHEERIRVEFHGTRGVATAESLALGETRAFVQNLGEARDGAALLGSIRAHRVLYGHMQPFVSVTNAPGADGTETNLFQAAQFHCGQSDGIPTAVFFATSFDPETGIPDYNAGVMVQPIAPSEARTNEAREVVGALQRSFQQILMPHAEEADEDDGTGIREVPPPIAADAAARVRTTLDLRLRQGWGVHDMLALGTGDWEGAGRAVEKARLLGGPTARRLLQRQLSVPAYADLAAQYGATAPFAGLLGDADAAESSVPNSRARRCDLPPKWLGFDAQHHGTRVLELDEATMVKTPLDFVCRCTKQGFMEALRSVGRDGVEARRAADPDMAFRCGHCAKDWRLEPKDWDTVLHGFALGA